MYAVVKRSLHVVHGNLNRFLSRYPSLTNIGFLWYLGSLAGIFFVAQIVTGLFLTMLYTPQIDMAFHSLDHIMRNIESGWLIRYMHANGASFFFIFFYMHNNRLTCLCMALFLSICICKNTFIASDVNAGQQLLLLTREIVGAALDSASASTSLSVREYNVLVALERDIINYPMPRSTMLLSELPEQAQKLLRFAKIYLRGTDIPMGTYEACLQLLTDAVRIYSGASYANDAALQEYASYITHSVQMLKGY